VGRRQVRPPLKLSFNLVNGPTNLTKKVYCIFHINRITKHRLPPSTALDSIVKKIINL
jgi:hypothetical protein